MAHRVGRLTLGWITACGLLPDTAALSPGGPPYEGWKPVVYAARDPDTGVSWLKMNGYLLQQSDQPREFTFRGLRRYDTDARRWVKVELPVGRPTVLRPESRRAYSQGTDRRLVRLTERTALFWVEWEEDGHRVSTLLSSGPVSCNDVEIGDPPEGMIAACVPFGDHAKAMFVPDPERRQRGRATAKGAKDEL